MKPVLFDSSIYIRDLRGQGDLALSARFLAANVPIWLSAVVLEELYAGSSARDRGVVERLARDFTHAKRVVVPNLNDWTLAGLLLSKFGAKYGYESIGRGRLTNAALIATSASGLGITVITANVRDFARVH